MFDYICWCVRSLSKSVVADLWVATFIRATWSFAKLDLKKKFWILIHQWYLVSPVFKKGYASICRRTFENPNFEWTDKTNNTMSLSKQNLHGGTQGW